MVDPNAPELLAALETFANEVQEIFKNGEQDAETGPIAAKQKQHMLAALAVAKKAKIAGLWVEKSETENTNLHYAISDQLPTEQQWEAERVESNASN